MKNALIPALFLLIIGASIVVGALSGRDWFMNTRMVQKRVKMLGKDGVRIFYLVIGLAITIIASFMLIEGGR